MTREEAIEFWDNNVPPQFHPNLEELSEEEYISKTEGLIKDMKDQFCHPYNCANCDGCSFI